MEFHPYEDVQRRDDGQDKNNRKRRFLVGPAKKTEGGDWLNPSEAAPKPSPEPEQQHRRMPMSIVAPESSPAESRTIPHEATLLHSDAWLGREVQPLDERTIVMPISHEAAADDDEDEDEDDKKDKKQAVYRVPSSPPAEAHDRQEPPAPIPAPEAPAAANVPEAPAPPPVAERPPSRPTVEVPEVPLTAAEDNAFQRLLERAGLDDLYNSFEQSADTQATEPPSAERPSPPAEAHDRQEPPAPIPAPEAPAAANVPEAPAPEPEYPEGGGGSESPPFGGAENGAFASQPLPPETGRIPLNEQQHSVDLNEYMPRTQAKTRALVAFAAGLIIGNHFGKKKVRRELTKTLEEIEDKMTANEADRKFEQRQVERKDYNEKYWQHRLNRPGQPAGVAAPRLPLERQPAATIVPELVPNAAKDIEPDAGEDPFNLKPEEHVERDAWHSIVVDKYGHEDVNARQQYGRAFEQEQREVRSSALSDDAPVGSGNDTSAYTEAATQGYAPDLIGSSTGAAPVLSGPMPAPQLPMPTATSMSYLPTGSTEQQLPAGAPIREDPQHLLPAHVKAGASLLVNPWVWLIAGLLILVFFFASLV